MLQYRKKGKKHKKNQIIVLKMENKEHSQINFQIQIMDIYKIKTISAADYFKTAMNFDSWPNVTSLQLFIYLWFTRTVQLSLFYQPE